MSSYKSYFKPVEPASLPFMTFWDQVMLQTNTSQELVLQKNSWLSGSCRYAAAEKAADICSQYTMQ